jgi:hypothetical protein
MGKGQARKSFIASGMKTKKRGKRRCKMRARMQCIGYTATGAPVYGMVARGATYPYSSIRQDARNKRKFERVWTPPLLAGKWPWWKRRVSCDKEFFKDV